MIFFLGICFLQEKGNQRHIVWVGVWGQFFLSYKKSSHLRLMYNTLPISPIVGGILTLYGQFAKSPIPFFLPGNERLWWKILIFKVLNLFWSGKYIQATRKSTIVAFVRFVSFRFMSLLVSLIAPLLVSFIPTDWNNKFFGIYRRPNRLVCRCNSSQCPRVVENEYRDNP